MGFINAWQLWLGLGIAGVAVPIIIHLLYRKHRKQTDWAAMELLRRAMVIRSGQVKLEDYIILALRCLALALIAWALLRPTVGKDSPGWIGEPRVGVVVAIDASYSMNHGTVSRFEKAKAKASEILATVTEGDPVSVMLMSNRPEILLRATGYEPKRFTDALDAVKDPTPYRLSLERNIERLDELASELDAPARECFLITDAQELDWAKLSPNGRESLERLAARDNVNVFVVPVSTDGDDNLSITELSYASGSLRQSESARFVAHVANQGREATNGGMVEFFANEKLISRRAIGKVDPGKTTPVSFVHSFDTKGDVRIRARLGKDELTTDNDRFAVVNIRSKINILCVDGDTTVTGAGDDASRRGVTYAVTALRLKMRGPDSPVQVTQIEAPDMSQETLASYDIILMSDVPDVSPEMVERLEQFTERGGGLIFFVGDQVEAEIYNKRFAKLLPAEFVETIEPRGAATSGGSGGEAWNFGTIISSHPLAMIAKDLPKELMDTARFSKVMKVKAANGGQTILSLSEDNTPLLLSRPVGEGTVLLFTTSADREWSNLPVHPLYTMLLQQAATNLTSQPDTRKVTVGEPAELSLAGRKVGERVDMNKPEGKVNVTVTQNGARIVAAVDTDLIGIYEVPGVDEFPTVAIAANVDPDESNVRVVDAGALSNELTPAGIEVVEPGDAITKAIELVRGGAELTRRLLIAGIVIFLLQSLLARYFTHRMSEGETDVIASLQMSRVAAARRS